jgi:hypothetical protein
LHQLLDGRTDTPGWRSADGYLPQEFVFAFRGDQVALIGQIILRPKTPHDPTTWPKRITVSVLAESPLGGFQEVGQFTPRQEPRDQAFPIGRRARFVKLRILENFGGEYTSLGEVKLLEDAAQDYESILRETPEAMVISRGAAPSESIDETGVALETEPNGTPADDLAANLIASTAAMSFSQLDKTLNVRTKVGPLVLAGLVALTASLAISSLPGADESLVQANAGLIQTSSPGVIGAPMEHDAIIYSARFSPGGKRIVTASKDGTARVWDAATGDPVGEPMQSNEAVCAARFSPDGRRVVTASWITARVWDVSSVLSPK